MNTFNIRLAMPTDIDAIVTIERECFDEDIAFNRRQLRRFISQGNTLVAVKEPDSVVGQITLWRRSHASGNHLRIYNLAVLVAQRGHGLWQMLMKTGLQKFVDSFTTRVSLEVELGNSIINWYEKIGFYREKVLKEYYRDNRDGIRMVLLKSYFEKIGEQ